MNWLPCRKCGKVEHVSKIVEIRMLYPDTPDGMPIDFQLCKSCADEIKVKIKKNAPHYKIKEENTMTNAELAKQIKEFAEKLDRYYANQEETINKYDDKIVHLHNELEELAEKVNGLGIVAQETTRRQNEQVDRLDRYRDVQDKQFATYDSKIKQQSTSIGDLETKSRKAQAVFAELTEAYSNLNGRLGDYKKKHSDVISGQEQLIKKLTDVNAELEDRLQQLETAQKQLRLTIISTYGIPEKSKTIESMYPCLWNCEHKGKECNGQAQVCPIAEHFSEELKTGHLGCELTEEEIKYMENDILCTEEDKSLWAEDLGKFNAGKMAIVFDGNDPHFEAAYVDFCRAFDEWCDTSKTEDKLIPQSEWPFQIHRMDPFMKCSSIYKGHSSFAIWTEHNEEANHTFEYGTLQSTWREHKTVGGLPYTVWKI